MSLNITIYTFSLTGQRQTVRGVDWKSVIENWSVRKPSKEERNQEIEILIQNMTVFAAIIPPIIDQMTKTPQNDGMLSRFQNIANATAEAKQLNGGIEIS